MVAAIHSGEESVVVSPTETPTPPQGYTIYQGRVSPGLAALAKAVLSKEMGTLVEFRYEDGSHGIARVEPHPPAPERGLTFWHKGVTLYVSIVPTHPSTYIRSGLVLVLLLGVGYIYARRQSINETLSSFSSSHSNKLYSAG